MTTIGAGAVATASTVDFLQDDIIDPDFFEERTLFPKGVRTATSRNTSNEKNWSGLLYTVGIIILSAAIFVTVVAWLEVLRSLLDSIYVKDDMNKDVIKTHIKSRLYYALIVTTLSLTVSTILLGLWYYEILMPQQRSQKRSYTHHVIHYKK
jgi:hypothetical protein